MRRNADRLLAGRRVGDEQHLLRFQEFLQLLDLLDQCRVDFLPAGGVEIWTLPLCSAAQSRLAAAARAHSFR